MTISLKHAFTSAIPVDTEAQARGEVTPDNWNAEHTLTMGSGRLLGRSTSGGGVVEEIGLGGNLSLTAGILDFSGDVATYETRATAAAATIPVIYSIIKINRYDASGLFEPAPYKQGSSSGPGAFQDAAGTWWEIAILNGVVWASWFGARFDGDNTHASANVTAVNAAITAIANAGGGIVELSAGTMCVTGAEIRIKNSNIWLRGRGPGITVLELNDFYTGTIIKALNATNSLNVADQISDISITDLTIDGNNIGVLSATATANALAGAFTVSVNVPTGVTTGMFVWDQTKFDSNGYNSGLMTSPFASISSLTSTSITVNQAITAPGVTSGDTIKFVSTDSSIQFLNTSFVTVERVHLINIYGYAGIISQQSDNVRICNNYIAASPTLTIVGTAGILGTATGTGCNAGVISNNVIVNSCIEWVGKHNVIADNDVIPANSGGIIIDPNSLCSNNVVRGNRVHDGTVMVNHDGITGGAGIEGWGQGLIIADNVCWNNSGVGISCGGAGSLVVGNVSYDNNQGAVALRSGIFLDVAGSDVWNNAQNITISGNNVFNTGSPGTQDYALWINAAASGIRGSGNTFRAGNTGTISGTFTSDNTGAITIAPTIVGGSTTTSTITYKTTTANGASGADHIFVVGNNGATEVLRLRNNGSGLFSGALTLSGAITYGGVTLNNAVTGAGKMVLDTNPVLVTPNLGTPSAVTLTSATGLPVSTGISGLGTGIATALAVNVGTAGSPIINGGALGSPSSAGTLPAFTLGGTVSGGGKQINNVIIGTSTPLAGAFTSVSATLAFTSTRDPSTGPHFDTSGSHQFSISASSSAAIASGGATAAHIKVYNASTGNASTWLAGNGTIVLETQIGSDAVASTSSPGAGKYSLAFSTNYTIFNGSGSTQVFRVNILQF